MKKLFTLLFFISFGIFANVTISNAQYCTPQYSSGCIIGDGLTNFSMGTINQAIPCTGTPSYYHDYTSGAPTTMMSGATQSISFVAGYSNTYVTVWIDFNNNNTFDASEIVVNSYKCTSSSTTYTTNFTVPTGVYGNFRLRYRTNWYSGITDPCSSVSYGNAADFPTTIPAPAPMYYQSSTISHPDTNNVFIGQQRIKIAKATITTHNGSYNPVTIGNVWFSLGNTTNKSDIEAIRFFHSDGAPLSLNDTIGGPVTPDANGMFMFPGNNSTLNYGDNNLWIGFDVATTAGVDHILDCQVDSAIVDDTMRYPSLTNALGHKKIVHPTTYKGYCNVTRQNAANYAIGIKRVRFETIDNSTITLAGGLPPNNTAVQVYSSPVPTIYKQLTYPITINHGELNTQSASLFVDWNNDGYFSSNERVFTTGSLPAASTTKKNITVPCSATAGYHRMRISSDLGSYTPPACGVTRYGEVEDYFIYVAAEDTPVVSFTNADTAYIGGMTKFYPVSNINGNIEYLWDYDSDNVIDDTANVGAYVFTTAGSKTVTLKAVLYGCEDTIVSNPYTGTIPVVAPYSTPIVNFISNLNTITTSIPVSFTDLTTLGPSTWKWKIEPKIVNSNSAYTFQTTDTEQNPELTFHELGSYTVTLVVTNSVGIDSNVKVDYITVVKEQLICNDVSSNLRTGYLYDDGGKYANYSSPSSAGNTCGYVISPKCASSVTFDFLDFDVCSYTISTCPNLPPDAVKIYDGVDNTGTALHLQFVDMLGTPIYPNGFTNGASNVNIGIPPSVTATTGSMYVEFFTNCAAVGTGFEGKWSTQIFTPNPPQASISSIDTIFTGQTAYFNSTSTGYMLDYEWDFTGNGYGDSQDSLGAYVYNTPGTYNVRLVVFSCDFSDTAFKTFVVVNPSAKPVADFEADYLRVTQSDLVSFTDKSIEGVYDWEWTITPTTFTYENGTNSFSKNIQVKFTALGDYDVKLIATNAIGYDSLIKADYITVYYNCEPGVANLNPDIGISEFTLTNLAGDTLINNLSSIGVSDYSNYSKDFVAELYKTGNYVINLKRNTQFNNITRTAWIDFNQDGQYDNSEIIAVSNNSDLISWTANFSVPNTSLSGLTKLRIAANAGILSNNGCGPNYSGEFEDYGVILKSDNVKPYIKLYDTDSNLVMGNDSMILNSCATYIDPGYFAWDDVSGDLTSNVTVNGVSAINSLVPADYPVTYDVTDNANNNAVQMTRIVTVLSDIVKPTITLYGNNPAYVAVFSTYSDPGYIATDDCSGIDTDGSTGTINTNVVGEYEIKYFAADKATPANVDTIIRTVYVYDSIMPNITINGNDTLYFEVHSTFTDPGATVTDNYWMNLDYTVTGVVDMNTLGTYFLKYSVTDSSGNGPVLDDRVVIIEDNTAPTITFDKLEYTVEVFESFTAPNPNISDNYWESKNILLTKTGSVNTLVLGDYILTYVAKDASGNVSAQVQLTVHVVDLTAPKIDLLGQSLVTIIRWADFNDPGIKVTDNYYDFDDLTITYGGTYDSAKQVGLYSYTYTACDPSGNCSQEVTRFIYVEQSISIAEKIMDENIKFYPNPANEVLNIDVDLPAYTTTKISIYNTLGEHIMNIHDGLIKNKHFNVNISNLSSGIYYIRFNTDNSEPLNKKFIIAR